LNSLKDLIYEKRKQAKYLIGLLLEDPERWPKSESTATPTGN
jgi:hypothetical protein